MDAGKCVHVDLNSVNNTRVGRLGEKSALVVSHVLIHFEITCARFRREPRATSMNHMVWLS